MSSPRELARIVADVRTFCAAHANAAQAQRYAKFFTEGYDAYGIDKDTWAQHERRVYDRHHETLTLEDFLDLGDLLTASGKYEEASFAITTIRPLLDRFTPATVQRIGVWLERGVRNWAHTDVICRELLEPCLTRGVISPADLWPWRDSTVKWKRRAVPVALIALVGERSRTAALLDGLRPLMLDQERVVHQGVGWFLREAWKVNPKMVEAFLLEWKDRAPRLIYQYATEKMDPARKERFRRGNR